MTDIFQQRYYRNNKLFLSLLGQWPYQSRRGRLFLRTLVIFLLTLNGIPQIIAVLKFRDDPDVIVASIPPFLFIIIFGTKFANITVNSEKMLKILQHIEIDWISMAQQPEIHILRNYAEEGRRFTIAYAVGIYLTMVIYAGQSCILIIQESIKTSNETPPKTFPYPVDYYGLDIDTYFFYLATFMCSVVVICVLIIIAVDTMFVVQVQHACGMFTILGYQLQRIANDMSEEYVNYNSGSQMDPAFQRLVLCIEKHKNVIKFSNLLEASYTWASLIIAGSLMMGVSIVGFQAAFAIDTNPNEVVGLAMLAIADIFALFFQSFYCQKLINHSQQIGEYLGQADWYKTSLATQKLVCLVIMRARVPCQLTAGNFIVMSLENFTVILKTSFSYFSLMRSTM